MRVDGNDVTLVLISSDLRLGADQDKLEGSRSSSTRRPFQSARETPQGPVAEPRLDGDISPTYRALEPHPGAYLELKI